MALLMTVAYLHGQNSALELATRKADSIADQRYDKKIWGQKGTKAFTKKTISLKEWDKNFSSIGSKRSSIAMEEGKDKKLFQTQIKTFENKDFKMEISRWNEKMKDLHKSAGIKMDDKAQLIADQKLYSEMLKDSKSFSDMAEEVSLRDLNRYQFRRNRSDEAIPVKKAASSE